MKCEHCGNGDGPNEGTHFCSPACAIQWVLNTPADDPAWRDVPMPSAAISTDMPRFAGITETLNGALIVG